MLDESKFPEWMPREGERVIRSYGNPEIAFRLGRTGDGGETERTVVTINTPQEDRHGTIIEAKGVDLEPYRENPIVLFMHDPYNPLANNSRVKLNGNNLVAATDDADWDLETTEINKVYRWVKKGIVRMASIGIQVRKTLKELKDPDGDPYDWRNIRVRIIESELREWSFATIASNRGALVTERMASGLFAPAQRPLVFPLSTERTPDAAPPQPDPDTPEADEPAEDVPAQEGRTAPAEEPAPKAPARPPKRITRAEAQALVADAAEVARLEIRRSLGRA